MIVNKQNLILFAKKHKWNHDKFWSRTQLSNSQNWFYEFIETLCMFCM